MFFVMLFINGYSNNHPPTPSCAFNLESNIPPRSLVAFSKELGNGQLNNNPPDINLETPAVTQSKPKTKFNLNDFPNADPGNKWVKRLKLTSANPSSFQGTKSSNFASNKLLNSEPTLEEQRVKKLHENWDFSMKDEDQLMENPKDKCKALLLSHAWIQRWLHNQQAITAAKPEVNVVCEPLSSKLTMEKLRKERLPSIAAMALMAKALTCFQPCELQKRGPFTFWNTKIF